MTEDRAAKAGPAAAGALVRVHIETLELDCAVAARAPDVARAVERELTRLLGAQLPSGLDEPGHTPSLAAPLPRGGESASGVGSRIAHAVHTALGRREAPR